MPSPTNSEPPTSMTPAADLTSSLQLDTSSLMDVCPPVNQEPILHDDILELEGGPTVSAVIDNEPAPPDSVAAGVNSSSIDLSANLSPSLIDTPSDTVDMALVNDSPLIPTPVDATPAPMSTGRKYFFLVTAILRQEVLLTLGFFYKP